MYTCTHGVREGLQTSPVYSDLEFAVASPPGEAFKGPRSLHSTYRCRWSLCYIHPAVLVSFCILQISEPQLMERAIICDLSCCQSECPAGAYQLGCHASVRAGMRRRPGPGYLSPCRESARIIKGRKTIVHCLVSLLACVLRLIPSAHSLWGLPTEKSQRLSGGPLYTALCFWVVWPCGAPLVRALGHRTSCLWFPHPLLTLL